MKLLRILLGFVFLAGFLWVSAFSDFFRVWKLQAAGHQVIESEYNLSSWFTGREFFLDAKISPDQKTLAVRSTIVQRMYDGGQLYTSLFDLQTGKRIWRVKNENVQTLSWTTHLFVWDAAKNQILGYGFPNSANVYDVSLGKIIRKLHEVNRCTTIQATNGKMWGIYNCLEGRDVVLVSEKDFSVVWTKPYKEALKIYQQANQNSTEPSHLSPNELLYSKVNSQSIEIFDVQTNQLKFPAFTTLWSTRDAVWSQDSTMLAVGGDNYGFKGVSTEAKID
jgi:hypothetical protein